MIFTDPNGIVKDLKKKIGGFNGVCKNNTI